MMRKAALGGAAIVLLLVSAFGVMYLTNAAPVVPSVTLQSDRPIVVKFHARWCVLCMATKGVWEDLHEAYRRRVDLVVFDFTSDETTQAARVEAQRLGLERVFDEYYGTTGSVFVLDGRSKAVRAEIRGDRNFGEYRTAIDAALADARR